MTRWSPSPTFNHIIFTSEYEEWLDKFYIVPASQSIWRKHPHRILNHVRRSSAGEIPHRSAQWPTNPSFIIRRHSQHCTNCLVVWETFHLYPLNHFIVLSSYNFYFETNIYSKLPEYEQAFIFISSNIKKLPKYYHEKVTRVWAGCSNKGGERSRNRGRERKRTLQHLETVSLLEFSSRNNLSAWVEGTLSRLTVGCGHLAVAPPASWVQNVVDSLPAWILFLFGYRAVMGSS